MRCGLCVQIVTATHAYARAANYAAQVLAKKVTRHLPRCAR
jgi:hypothetical protein